MRLVLPRGLPSKRTNTLTDHPEPHHLQMLYALACRCGPAPAFVEQGITSGHVTATLLAAMGKLPGSTLTLLGEVPDHVQALVAGREDTFFSLTDVRPSLWFIGAPEHALEGSAQAEQLGSRVIIVYDTRTTERFGLDRYLPAAQAAIQLMANPERAWNSVCSSVQFQQTRRGMLVSELKNWQPQLPAVVVETPVEVAVELTPIGPASRFGSFRKTRLP